MRTATVTQSSRDRTNRNLPPVIVGSVEDRLQALDPGVRVVDGGEHRGGSYWDALGWRGPGWSCSPIVGIPAYLLLGGPVELGRPKPLARLWLTGGWAFLLGLLFGGGSAAG